MKLTRDQVIKLETDSQRRVATGTKPSNSKLHIPATRRGHRRRGGSNVTHIFSGMAAEELAMRMAISAAGRRQQPRTDTTLEKG